MSKKEQSSGRIPADVRAGAMIPVLDMVPLGRDRWGSPIYRFSTSFPSTGVRVVGAVCVTKEEAYAVGANAVRAYVAADPFGNMGSVCGVTVVEGGYRAVINTYHSNT